MYSLLNEQEMKFYFSKSQTPAPTHVMCQLLVLCWSCYQQRHNELVTSLRRPHAPPAPQISGTRVAKLKSHSHCAGYCWMLRTRHEKIKLAEDQPQHPHPPILVLARHGGCGRINAAAVFILCHNLESNKICCKLMISFRFTPLLRSVKVKSDIFRTV